MARIRERANPSAGANQVRDERSVRYAEPNFIFQPSAVMPDDSDFSQLWGLHNTGQAIAGTRGQIFIGAAGHGVQGAG